MNNKHNHCTPEQLYLKMLEIGSECISCGIKYHDLKSKLCLKGLLNSNDSDETIKILFENSFTDRNSTCLKPYYEEEKPCDSKYGKENDEHFKYNHLENCIHYLTPEAMMNLLHLRESENNRIASETAKTISTRALYISGGSLFIAILLGLSPLFYDKCYTTKELQSLQQTQESISKTLPTLKTMRDSFSKQLILIQKDVHNANLLKNNPYKVFSLKLKTDLKTDNKNLKTVESLNK